MKLHNSQLFEFSTLFIFFASIINAVECTIDCTSISSPGSDHFSNCQMPKETGNHECLQNSTNDINSQVSEYRWYFNWEKSTCMSFKYNGCNGNGNNFQTLEQCMCACVYPVADRGRCWGKDKSWAKDCEELNCKKPLECTRGAFFANCCYKGDDTCPDGSDVLWHETNQQIFGDTCDDLNCPNTHYCHQGLMVARCCQKTD